VEGLLEMEDLVPALLAIAAREILADLPVECALRLLDAQRAAGNEEEMRQIGRHRVGSNVSTNSASRPCTRPNSTGWSAARRSFFVNSGVFIPMVHPTGLVAKKEKKSRRRLPWRESKM